MKIIGKVLKGLFIGNDQQPVNVGEVITAIAGNFKKSPQTTIAGLIIVIIGVVLLLTKPELDTVAYSLIGGGFTLLGVRDVWSRKHQPSPPALPKSKS